jgi:hypothetical protein
MEYNDSASLWTEEPICALGAGDRVVRLWGLTHVALMVKSPGLNRG